MSSTTVTPALRALLERVVDYAGLFPPASLTMQDAVVEYAMHRKSAESWMLGRFVVPIGRLQELRAAAAVQPSAEAWPLSVLVSADPAGDAAAIRAFNASQRGRLTVESVELRAATADAIDWALLPLDRGLERYVEIPLEVDWRPLLDAVKRHHASAKVRTGGVTSDAFPSAEVLARFIADCARVGVPFKATAGLHHPLRGEQRLTYEAGAPTATMFGFLNVFVAAALARSGVEPDVLRNVLDERDPDAFSFPEDRLRWRERTVPLAELAATRRDLALSFGSCSFREPVDDLRRMHLL